MKVCRKCLIYKPESEYYTTCTKKRDGLGFYFGSRLECKPCTLNRNEKERKDWKDGKYRVYILPKEKYCGYTNNMRHRMNQHARGGKDITNNFVIYKTSNPILAHLIETIFHLVGFNGFGPNVGRLTMTKYTNRRNLEKELEEAEKNK